MHYKDMITLLIQGIVLPITLECTCPRGSKHTDRRLGLNGLEVMRKKRGQYKTPVCPWNATSESAVTNLPPHIELAEMSEEFLRVIINTRNLIGCLHRNFVISDRNWCAQFLNRGEEIVLRYQKDDMSDIIDSTICVKFARELTAECFAQIELEVGKFLKESFVKSKSVLKDNVALLQNRRLVLGLHCMIDEIFNLIDCLRSDKLLDCRSHIRKLSLAEQALAPTIDAYRKESVTAGFLCRSIEFLASETIRSLSCISIANMLPSYYRRLMYLAVGHSLNQFSLAMSYIVAFSMEGNERHIRVAANRMSQIAGIPISNAIDIRIPAHTLQTIIEAASQLKHYEAIELPNFNTYLEVELRSFLRIVSCDLESFVLRVNASIDVMHGYYLLMDYAENCLGDPASADKESIRFRIYLAQNGYWHSSTLLHCKNAAEVCKFASDILERLTSALSNTSTNPRELLVAGLHELRNLQTRFIEQVMEYRKDAVQASKKTVIGDVLELERIENLFGHCFYNKSMAAAVLHIYVSNADAKNLAAILEGLDGMIEVLCKFIERHTSDSADFDVLNNNHEVIAVPAISHKPLKISPDIIDREISIQSDCTVSENSSPHSGYRTFIPSSLVSMKDGGLELSYGDLASQGLSTSKSPRYLRMLESASSAIGTRKLDAAIMRETIDEVREDRGSEEVFVFPKYMSELKIEYLQILTKAGKYMTDKKKS